MTVFRLKRLCTGSGCVRWLWERLLRGCREGSAGRSLLKIGWTLLDAQDETFASRAAGRRYFGTVIAWSVVGAGTGPAILGLSTLVLALSAGAFASPAAIGIVSGHAEMSVGLGTLAAEMCAAVSGLLETICGLVAARSLVMSCCCGVIVGSTAFVVR